MRVLVTAASRHGSTAEIARTIGRLLTDARIDSMVMAPEDVTSLEGYDAIVLGSAVYMGRWLEPATAFADQFQEPLRRRSVWLFSSGPLGEPPKPVADPAGITAIEASTMAIEHRMFAGRLVKGELGIGERLIVTGVRASYGDFRPWAEITSWAQGIARTLEAARNAV